MNPTWFLRFYDTSMNRVSDCIDELYKLGFRFESSWKLLTQSMNSMNLVGTNIELTLTFVDEAALNAFKQSVEVKEIYQKYGTPDGTAPVIMRNPGDVAFRVS